MEQIKVMPIILRELKRKQYNYSSLARSLNLSHNSTMLMFRRPSLQVSKLLKISKILEYNFFREIADHLPYSEPLNSSTPAMVKENDELKERIKSLELEVSILRQTIRDFSNR